MMQSHIKDCILHDLDQAADSLRLAAENLRIDGYTNEAAELMVKAEQIENRRGIIMATIPTRPTVALDVAAHIRSAFEDLQPGAFLSIAQIRTRIAEKYPRGVGVGAISARLFPAKGDTTVRGIVPGQGGPNNVKGAYKAEDF